MFLPPLDPILGPEAQKMHFLGFWGSIHVFLHVKMVKKSILRPGTLFFRLFGGWSPFMWSGLPPGLPLDPSGCYWRRHVSIMLETCRLGPFGANRGPNWALWGPIGGPIGAFGTPIGGPIGPFGTPIEGSIGPYGTPIGGPIGIMRTLKGAENGLLAG